MKISILIVNWNTRDLLKQCLQSIYADPPSGEYEVWVVDNASTDGSLEMLRGTFPQARVIASPENIGFARANNLAMRQARGEFFLLLNSDTVVQPGALDKLASALDGHPRAGVVGGRLVNPDGSIQESWSQFPTLASEILGRNFRGRSPVPGCSGLYKVDWVGGACMLVRKEAVQQVGTLDETYFMYSEEVDWCYRMHAAGWNSLYLENAEIVHLGGGSASRSSLNQLVRLYSSKLHFFQKNYGLWQARCLRACLILIHLMRVAWRWLAVVTRRYPAGEQRSRIQTQWQLVRWLLAGSYS